MSSFFGGGRIAQAVVKVTPDLSGFQAELQASINKAVAGVRIPPLGGRGGLLPVTAPGGAGGGRGGGPSTFNALFGGARGGPGGVNELSKSTQALRGSLIGLSRVTPVTVFGLGLYGTAAVAAGTAIKSAISSTADFEHQLNVFQATTGATAAQMQQVSDKAKALGADLSLPNTSAGDAARSMTELAKAGLSVEDTLAGSTGVLQLAAAAQIDVGSAATFVATQLNAFGLAGTQATHVADLLAGASIAAQGEITDFGTSFQQVSAVAKQAGVTIETTTGALVELAKAGLRGADGGTSLRTALLRLTPTTKQAAQYQKALGIELDQNRTIGEQLPKLLDQYKKALAGLTPVMRQQAITQIFGQDAYRAASILIEGGSKALRENTNAANQNGAASRLAAANAKGLTGAFNGLKSNLDTLGITLGEFVSGPLEGLVRGLSDTVTFATDGATALGKFSKALDSIHLPEFLTGEKGKKSNLGTTLNKVLQQALFLGPTVYKDIKKDIEDARRTVREEIRRGKAIKALGEAGGSLPFGISGFLPSDALKQQIKAGQFGISDLDAPIKLTKAQKKARDAIKALIEGAKKAAKIDLSPPNKLQIAQLNAQIAANLQAELTADKAIEAYFRGRLARAKEGTDKYTQILAALQAANSATRSVQAQIDAQRERARADAEQERKKQKDAAEKAKADAAATAQALFQLQKSRLDLRIEAAGLTPGIADDVRFNRAEIAFFKFQIKKINAIKKRRRLTLEEQQAVVDYRSAIIGLRATIKSLKDDAAANGGFSLADLFKEAVNQLNEFGSNVSQRPMTPGQVGETVLAGYAAGYSKLSNADRLKLLKASETNDLLAAILVAVKEPGRHDRPGQHTGENEYGPGYYKLPPGQRAMERARRMGAKVLPN